MAIPSSPEVCCVCGGFVTLYTKNEANLDTPWGKFTLQFHKACDTEQTRELIGNRLKKVALEKKP